MIKATSTIEERFHAPDLITAPDIAATYLVPTSMYNKSICHIYNCQALCISSVSSCTSSVHHKHLHFCSSRTCPVQGRLSKPSTECSKQNALHCCINPMSIHILLNWVSGDGPVHMSPIFQTGRQLILTAAAGNLELVGCVPSFCFSGRTTLFVLH